MGGRPVRLRRGGRRGVDQLRQRRPVQRERRVRGRRGRLERAGHDVVRGGRRRPRRVVGPGAPAGSAPNANDWIVGTAGRLPHRPSARSPKARSPARRRSSTSSRTPSARTPSSRPVGSSTTSRPVRAREPDPPDLLAAASSSTRSRATGSSRTSWPTSGSATTSPLDTWQHIWLNEGFATYAEWLWSEREGPGTAQQIFDFVYAVFPPDSPFWSLPIGDPGPDAPLRHARLRPWGDDPAPAPPRGRRRDFFRRSCTAGSRPSRWIVTTDEFIAPGRGHLRSGPGRALRDLALHAGHPTFRSRPRRQRPRLDPSHPTSGSAPAAARNLFDRLG